MGRWKKQLALVLALALALGDCAWATSDPSMNSTSYSATETQVGGIGDFNESSTNYSLKPGTDDGGATLGEAATGNSSSTNYQSNSGFNTTAQPGLMLNITSASVNLGILSTSGASTGTAAFSVRDYTSSGYNVYMYGTTPTYGGHSLAALTSDTAYTSNTEMFGVNLVSNGTVGGSANPACQATGFCYSTQVAGDGSTGTYGSTRPYTIANSFRFPFPATTGEIIAHAPQSSGETDYVMSVMAGISTLTPGGSYQGNITLVATGSY
jgi:hypothetical protein